MTTHAHAHISPTLLNPQALALHGPPGAGKTTAAAAIVAHMNAASQAGADAGAPATPIAYHFCSAADLRYVVRACAQNPAFGAGGGGGSGGTCERYEAGCVKLAVGRKSCMPHDWVHLVVSHYMQTAGKGKVSPPPSKMPPRPR